MSSEEEKILIKEEKKLRTEDPLLNGKKIPNKIFRGNVIDSDHVVTTNKNIEKEYNILSSGRRRPKK